PLASAVRQVNQLQRLGDQPGQIASREPSKPCRVGDEVGDRHVWVVTEVLGQVADPIANLAGCSLAVYRQAVDCDRAGAGWHYSGQGPEQGRLTCAIRAE